MIYIMQRDSLFLEVLMKVIAYVRFGNSPDTIPVAADSYEISKEYKERTHFKGVTSLSDPIFSKFKIDEIILQNSKISHISIGSEIEEVEEVQEQQDSNVDLTNEEDDSSECFFSEDEEHIDEEHIDDVWR